MEEDMEVVDDLIDLTNDSFMEFPDGGQATISDEDFAKRLQMEELETLRASDFLVAQQLQDEMQREDLSHLDPARISLPRSARQAFLQRPRATRPVPLPPADSSDEAEGSAPVSLETFRPYRVQRAIVRNRTAQDGEGSSRPSNAVAADDGGGGTLEHDAPPPIPLRSFRHVRRRAENPTAPDATRPRIHFTGGHRIRMLHPFIRARDPYLHLLDFDNASGNNYDALWDLSERIGDVGCKGLSKTEINRLPTIKYRTSSSRKTSNSDARESATASDANGLSDAAAAAAADDDDEADVDDSDCRICLSEFSDNDVLRTLPCCHRFHVACIDQWIKKNAVCPVCRDDIRGHVRIRGQDDWNHDNNFMS